MYFKAIFTNMSDMRRRYALRLAGRCVILVIGVLFCIFDPSQFTVLRGMNFFQGPTWLHLLWGIWVIDMIVQLLPIRAQISLGSQKLWRMRFKPIREKISMDALTQHIISISRSALWVLLLWCALIAVIGLLAHAGIMTDTALFMTTILFYVCDLICVLIWCPFRLIMKNRCCTTCRIFNWDHLMMFSPLLFTPSFYCWSLLGMSIAAWLVWEITILIHPERFWEKTNGALTCASCTDKLCTQYCRKLRPARDAARNAR
ncbi:MAG: hypothetical protein IJZ74_08835 [Clostridia bacterium]|nr:hypothetical protein [Clostridia bacterium]